MAPGTPWPWSNALRDPDFSHHPFLHLWKLACIFILHVHKTSATTKVIFIIKAWKREKTNTRAHLFFSGKQEPFHRLQQWPPLREGLGAGRMAVGLAVIWVCQKSIWTRTHLGFGAAGTYKIFAVWVRTASISPKRIMQAHPQIELKHCSNLFCIASINNMTKNNLGSWSVYLVNRLQSIIKRSRQEIWGRSLRQKPLDEQC